MHRTHLFDRRMLLAGLGASVALAAAPRAFAAGLGGGLRDILGHASDSSLEKLAQPGAFYADPAIRIALPLLGHGGLAGTLMSVLDKGQQLGLTDNVVRKLNDAAGLAAREAKPVFRAAIDKLSLSDVPDLATKRDGATQYLRSSAGGELKGKLRPLVDAGLAKVGAFRQIDRLAARSSLIRAAGITRDGLGNSVTDQALNGIFSYIGAEEGRLRDNPVGAVGGLLKGLLGN
ncbi:MAG: hypothetical protein RIS94_2491 [Pseudomonadota bacterium]|jgi:hypothetical protein